MPADLSRVPHVNQRPAPWQPEPVVVQAPRERRFPVARTLAVAYTVALAAVLVFVAVPRFASHPKPDAIPDRGQLIQAAAAYSANQADAGGMTVTNTKLLGERLLSDGRAQVKLEVWTSGGVTANHFIEWVTLKRHLWIGADYRLCAVRPGHPCV